MSFDALVDDISGILYGYGLVQPRAAFLTTPVTATDLQLTVDDAEGFEQGIAEVGNEIVFIKSVDYGSNILNLSADGRGYLGSAATAHGADTRVTMAPTWSRNRIATAVREAIADTYPQLFRVASTSFPFNPAVNTYDLPADCDRILKVTADSIGPTREQVELNRYSFNSVAPTQFATGNTITLEKGGFPGRSITVTYSAPPDAEVSFGDDFTDSGLAATAKTAIKYAACSTLLSYMDSARLPVDTATADELDSTSNQLGSAARISTQLYQRYLLALDKEASRLRASTPVPIKVRTR